MYDRDMPIIRAHGLSSPKGLCDVITFVLLTIQQPFPMVRDQFIDVQHGGDTSVYLFGSKRAGYRYARDHAEVLFAAISKAVETRDVIAAIDVLTLVPGLGLVKAGFVAQCLGLEASCLDTHNLARLGMSPNSVRLSKKLTQATKTKKITAYLKLCKRAGGSRYFWDSWCEYVSGLYKKLDTADAVSAFHVKALGLS